MVSYESGLNSARLLFGGKCGFVGSGVTTSIKWTMQCGQTYVHRVVKLYEVLSELLRKLLLNGPTTM